MDETLEVRRPWHGTSLMPARLLGTYNTDIDKTPAAEACVSALEDSTIFPQCLGP